MEPPTLQEYVEGLLGDEDSQLRSMRDEAIATGIPSIEVPSELGRVLQILIVATGARRVLEFGALFGYSGILMARALSEDGLLVTLEASSKHADVARQNFEKAGVAHKVDLRQGRALDVLPTLGSEPFDLIFIDADKSSYPRYLEWAIKLSRPGTVIVADNLWRDGGVVDPNTPDAVGAAQYNQALASNPRLLTAFIPRLDPSDAYCVSVVR